MKSKISLVLTVVMIVTLFSQISGIRPVYAASSLPVISNSNISISNITDSSVEMSWTAASSTVSEAAYLQYKVVYSLENNIDTVANAEKNGVVAKDWTAHMTSAVVKGLTRNSTYYFNVLVRDSLFGENIYMVKKQNTLRGALAQLGGQSGTELFLGGNYIELGVSNWGDFGTIGTKPLGFRGTSDSRIGMSADHDGYNNGYDLPIDYYLPGTPEERFAVGYQTSKGKFTNTNSAQMGHTNMPTVVTNLSDTKSGLLKAKAVSIWKDTMEITQVISFNVNDKFYRNDVTIKNLSKENWNGARYMRNFDPDNTVFQGGSYDTSNTVTRTIKDDGKAVVKAETYNDSDALYKAFKSRAPIFFYSNDKAAVASTFGFTNTDPYAPQAYASPAAKNNTIKADQAISITWDSGALNAGESKTFSYYTSLDERDFDEVQGEIITADIKNDIEAIKGMEDVKKVKDKIDGEDGLPKDKKESLKTDVVDTICDYPGITDIAFKDETDVVVMRKLITESDKPVDKKDDARVIVVKKAVKDFEEDVTDKEEAAISDIIGDITDKDKKDIASEELAGLKGWKIIDVVRGGIYTGSVTPKCSDATVVEVSLKKDGTPIEGYCLGTDIVNEGNYELIVKDATGRRVVVNFIIDKTQPNKPTILRTPDREFYNATYTFTILPGSDIGSGADKTLYAVSGAVYSDWKIYTEPFTISSEGTTKVMAKTVDKAGLESDVKEMEVCINKKMSFFPKLEITPDVDMSNLNYTIKLSSGYDADVADTVYSSVYSSVYYNITGMTEFKLYDAPIVLKDEGIYAIQIKVIDWYGNESKVTKTLIIDRKSPDNENAVLDGDKIILLGGKSTIIINPAKDKTDTIWVAPLGTTKFVEGSTMCKALGDAHEINVPSEDGEYRIYVIDRAGNVSEPSTKKVIVNRIPPKVSGVVDGGKYKTYPTISFEKATATLNEKPFVSGDVVKKNGEHTLIVTNYYGNKTTIKFVVDSAVEHVDKDKASLEIVYQPDNTKDRVTGNITLPTSGNEGSIITWKSSNPEIVGDDGVIKAQPKENMDITLTATITKDDAVQTKVFTIKVYSDITAPVITLKGEPMVIVEQGGVYNEKGYSAIDGVDGDLTNNVVVSGYFNTKVVGTYYLTYTVKDNSENVAVFKRVIKVVEKEISKESMVIAKNEEKIADTKLADAIKAAKDQSKTDIKIKVDKEVAVSAPVEVNISKAQVDNAKAQEVNVIFETNSTSIAVPMKAIDTTDMGNNSRLQLICEQVDSNAKENASMINAVKNINTDMSIYDNKIFDFKMKKVQEDEKGNALSEEIIHFSSEDDIRLRIFVGEVAGNMSLLTYYYNPQSGEWEYVRGNHAKGSDSVEILTNHLSIYSVMTLTPEQKREELAKLINDPNITVVKVQNILADDDMALDELNKYDTFEQQQKNEAAQGVIDGKETRKDKQYQDYNDLESEFNSVVNRIYMQLHSDTVAPEITLNGSSVIRIKKFGSYIEQGAKASDNTEGDITGRVVVTGEVTTYLAGQYTITYTVTDLAGNTSAVTRTVVVYDESSSNSQADQGGQVVNPVNPVNPVVDKQSGAIEVIKGKDKIAAVKMSLDGFKFKEQDGKLVSDVYNLNVTNGSNKFEGQVRIRYDQSKVSNENHLAIFAYDSTTAQWKCLGGIVDKDTDSITLDIATNNKIAVMEVNKTFNDLDGHWAKNIIEILAARQIITGDDKGNFSPNNGITRAEFATMISKILDLPVSEKATGFKDISEDAWYAPYIAAARKADIIKGVSETEYQANRIVSREEMTAIVMRAYRNVEGTEVLSSAINNIDKFSDSTQIGDWAYNDVYAAKYLKLVKGRDDQHFAPTSETLKAEAAVMVYNLLKALGKI